MSMLVGEAKDIMNCFQLVYNVSCVYVNCYLNSYIIEHLLDYYAVNLALVDI